MTAPPLPWSAETARRARAIRLVALDVDGVLSDGGITLDERGVESKRFHVRDGMGIRLLQEAGIPVGLITARRSGLVTQRARELRMAFLHQGVEAKWPALAQELAARGVPVEACAFMGDDLIDLPILLRVGLATAPADADAEVGLRVHWQASRPGGQGAVRELAELILRSQERWQGLLEQFMD